ncbi:MAG: hypothetical protein QXV32_00710 [Conexivisphaerales archaeon]
MSINFAFAVTVVEVLISLSAGVYTFMLVRKHHFSRVQLYFLGLGFIFAGAFLFTAPLLAQLYQVQMSYIGHISALTLPLALCFFVITWYLEVRRRMG